MHLMFQIQHLAESIPHMVPHHWVGLQSETRAFLSPPTLLEGPLRLSPLLPGGGGRGSRGPGNPLDHQITNERGESSCDRLTDPHRAPSDTGSLSPPWEQDRRMMFPPPGQSYPDSALPPQRQDRFCSNSGRLSGPAELRSFNMPSLDKMVGRDTLGDRPGVCPPPFEPECLHPAAPAVCDDNSGPGQPLPAKRPTAFKKPAAHSRVLDDIKHWSSDSELQSEIEDVPEVLSLLGVRLKPDFISSLSALVFLVEGPSFDSSVGNFSEEFLASKVTLLGPSLIDSSQDSDSEKELVLSFEQTLTLPFLLALTGCF
ncbi:hypothetical protein H8959_014836 [Pygathrix nigripes]